MSEMDVDAATAKLLTALPRSALTGAIGWLSERHVPRPYRRLVMGSLARAFSMDMGEAARQSDEFQSFQTLFCRALKPGIRPCEGQPEDSVSPVDGRLVAAGTIRDALAFSVKGMRYSVTGLLGGDAAKASRFLGGSYQVFYLSPSDYHRMHAPVSGSVTEYRWVRGDFWPVLTRLTDHLPNVYCDNERIISYLDSPLGEVAMIKVAAFGVGYISLSYLGEAPGDRRAALRRRPQRVFAPEVAPQIERGEELASFGLGSTVVLLYQPQRVALVAPTGDESVRVGGLVARARPGEARRDP